MKIGFILDEGDSFDPITVASALIHDHHLTAENIEEIAQHLMVYATRRENRRSICYRAGGE